MAPAESSSSFSGVASADGLRITTSAPGFLVVEDFIDAGGPTAQAAVSDVEGNRGFASVPYPGELAIAGPGLFAIATGQQFPGHYPFYVSSAHPTTPKNEYDVPGLAMKTQSDAGSSSSEATFGPADGTPGGAKSSAKVVHGAEGMTSEATGAADLVKVGPVEVAGFKSTAKVSRVPGGEPQRSSSMEFSVMKVGDTPVGVRDGQFVVAGTTMPLSGFAPAQKALADAGVSVEVVQATKTDDGVVSPGIQITRQQDAAAAGTKLIVRYTLGRALAAAKAEAGSASPGLDLGGATPPDFGSPAGGGGSGPPAAPAPDASSSSPSSASAFGSATGSAASSAGLGSGSGLGAGVGLGSGSGDGAGMSASAGPTTASDGGSASPAGATSAPATAEGSVDASLASAPLATGPIAPLSSWSFFPMLLLAGASVAVVALGRRLLVRS
jgi:hypothetical protein